jgi:hypothetical protein
LPLTLSLSLSSSTKDDDTTIVRIRQAIVDAGGESEWKASIESLSKNLLLGRVATTTAEQIAEDCLAEAFGWNAWARASESTKKYHRPTIPLGVDIDHAIHWLRTGPLSLVFLSNYVDDDVDERLLVKYIKTYPQIYLVKPHEKYRKAMGTAPRLYRDTFIELIKEDPSVLQITYNCDGEGCQSECGSCWVSYGNRLSVRSSQ